GRLRSLSGVLTHSRRSLAGGLILAQSAKEAIPPYRKAPGLEVSSKDPCTLSYHPAYPATGMAKAAHMTAQLAMVLPAANLLTRQIRKTISGGMPSDLTSAAAASSSPVRAQAHNGRSGHHIINATAIMTTNAQSVSLSRKCSSWTA